MYVNDIEVSYDSKINKINNIIQDKIVRFKY
jgi:hypothetical protein